jgi:hypothetical protein
MAQTHYCMCERLWYVARGLVCICDYVVTCFHHVILLLDVRERLHNNLEQNFLDYNGPLVRTSL